jgi:hypothetical protein
MLVPVVSMAYISKLHKIGGGLMNPSDLYLVYDEINLETMVEIKTCCISLQVDQ